jgi:hypothetical protein
MRNREVDAKIMAAYWLEQCKYGQWMYVPVRSKRMYVLVILANGIQSLAEYSTVI